MNPYTVKCVACGHATARHFARKHGGKCKACLIAEMAERFLMAEQWLGKHDPHAEAARFAEVYARSFAEVDPKQATFYQAVAAHIRGRVAA